MSEPVSSQEQQMAERLKRVFVDPVLQSKVVDVVVSNRPPGWSRRSNATYYKELYGKQLQEVIDGMMQDREDRCYYYADFSKIGIQKDTLYVRINQSLHYLLDKLDTPDRKYRRFLETVSVHRERGVGVMLRIKPEFRNSPVSEFVPKQVLPKKEIPKWKQQVDDFLENGEVGGKLLIEKLALTPDEIRELKISLAPLRNIMKDITSYSIKLVKINMP